MDGQGTKCRRNIAENLNRLSRVHERYRRQTDGRQHIYTFAKTCIRSQENTRTHRNTKIQKNIPVKTTSP